MDDEDDVPLVELAVRGDYLDAAWRAPGCVKSFGVHKLVDWKLKKTALFFFGLVERLCAARLDLGARIERPSGKASPLLLRLGCLRLNGFFGFLF